MISFTQNMKNVHLRTMHNFHEKNTSRINDVTTILRLAAKRTTTIQLVS